MASLVSILIPCHNAAPWIAQTLESVLAQTWLNREIIVVDDGSTDGSREIVSRFASRSVRLIAQRQAGAAAARNHAFRECRGDFVKFLDADDLLAPEMLSAQVHALAERSGHIAYAEWARFTTSPATAVLRPRPEWRDANGLEWLLAAWDDGEPMMQCGQYLLPRSLLQRAGTWDEHLTLIDDFEFFTRITLAGSGVIFTPGAPLFYRSNLPGSLSARRSAQAWHSAAQSTLLGTGYLLEAEDSPRTRAAAAKVLQGLAYSMYPSLPEDIAVLERRVAVLGGSPLRAQGGKGFQLASRVFGWKAARWLQILSGKHPWPVRSARQPKPQPAATA